MGDFNFNAPQYINFTSPSALELEDFGEEYFDIDHEIEIESNNKLSNSQDEMFSDARQSSNPDLSSWQNDNEESSVSKSNLRRSVSAGHIISNVNYASELSPTHENSDNSLINALNNLQLESVKKSNRRRNVLSILPSKLQISASEKPVKPIPKARSSSRDAIHKIGISNNNDKLKRKMSAENLQSLQPKKYISLAEAIHRFQFGTPQRFHTQSNKTQFSNVSSKMIALHHTIANSPALATKARCRPTTYLGHEEQEQIEAEEQKKHKIKAQPINYKVFRAPVMNSKSEVHVTQPQPFRFTEVKYHHTQPKEPEKVYEFHAKPAPRTTAPGVVPVSRRSVMPKIDLTKKNSPVRFTQSYRKKYQADTVPSVCDKMQNNKLNIKTVEMHYDGISKTILTQKPTKTQIKPFSFEARDKRIQEKKEEKIKKFLEEEKKAREFHARPIPIKVIGQNIKIESRVGKLISEGSSVSLNDNRSLDENIEPPAFKARPATVIHKKPFIPKKEERHLVEIQEFNLYTNNRAKEREDFDKKLKEKEEETEFLKKENEKYYKKLQEEEIKKIRKEIVHKAKPVKHYKPIEIVPSTKKVTSPITPFSKSKKLPDESD